MTGPSVNLVPGSVLAGYTIVRLLGAGGMGAVYLARHPRLPRHDALKVLYPALSNDPSFRTRFEREAHLASQLDNPNVVTVYDRGSTGEIMWLAMQFVDGSDVASLLRRHRTGLDPVHALDILGQAARGIDAAHRRGMLHRDIKPANLLVTPGWNGAPDSERVLVSDFGIARACDSDTALTQTETLLGTLAYAAPELLEAGDVDHTADIYALGCTFYQMLTGEVAFPRSNPMAVMNAHATAPPPRPTRTHPHLPPAIDTVIATAMAKRPADRYPTCRALADAAAAALTSPTKPYVPEPAPPSPTRRRYLLVAAAVVAVLVGAFYALRPDATDDAGRETTTTTDTAPASVTGTWTGEVSGDESGFDVVADITNDSPLTATVTYPQLDCHGAWSETRTDGSGGWRLTETIDRGSCVPSEVTITRNDDGTLDFTSTYYSASQNRNFTIHATLRR